MKPTRQIVLAWIIFTIALTACGRPTTTANEDISQVETIVASTLQAVTESAPNGIPVEFNNITFVIPNVLASGATPQVIPAVGDDGAPWEMAPEHLLFTLAGYPTSSENSATQPVILVYPAQAYAEINPGANISLPRLQALLASPSAPINPESAPSVPFYNAAQILVSNSGILNLQNGAGVRMIAHYSQFPSPIIQSGQVYHFQGLTSDGEYYIIAIFPVTSPLQSTSDNPTADGVPFPEMGVADEAEFDAYYQTMADKLSAAGADAFQPSLNQLDALIQSIQITP